MNLSDLKFNVELKAANAGYARFPRENCIGVSLLRPDENKRKYKLKILLQEETCKLAKITPYGSAMVKFSDCSNGMQILWQETQGDKFKGYRLRPSGTYNTEKQIKGVMKSRNTQFLPLWCELSVDFAMLDTKKTSKFDLKYVDIIHTANAQIVVDISDVRIFVNPPA